MPKRLIPFRFMPASWGLVGRSYAVAEAEYTLEGEALDRRLVEIMHSHDPVALAEKMREVDLHYGRIDQFTYDAEKVHATHEAGSIDHAEGLLSVELAHDRITQIEHDLARIDLYHEAGSVDQQIAALNVQLSHGSISKMDHAKECATLREEPWVGIIDSGFDLDQGINGLFFEFGWNAYWIEYLRINGYTGETEQDLVEQWWDDVNRNQSDQMASVPLGNGRAMRVVSDNGTLYS